MTTAPTAPRLHTLTSRLGDVSALDPSAKAVGGVVREAIPKGRIKDTLSGVPLGHALHPLLTQVVVGTWTSATLLDLLGGRAARTASRRLIAIGLAASAPTSLTGLNDWADSEAADDEIRRVGAVHGVLNVATLGLYGASLAARVRGRRATGVALGLAGAATLAASGHLGGHLAYAKGVGVDQDAFGATIAEWTDVGAVGELAEGGLRRAQAGAVAVVLTRRGGEVIALADRCAHRGGSLSEGTLADGCVECPLHGSRFRLTDGSVARGPSAYPQPVYETRIREGRVEVRSAPA